MSTRSALVPLLLVCSLVGCGGSGGGADAAVVPDVGAPVADGGADAAAPDARLLPFFDGPGSDTIIPDPGPLPPERLDAAVDRRGPPVPGAVCIMDADCDVTLICAVGRCHSQCREARDCPAGSARCETSNPAVGGGYCALPGDPTFTDGGTDGPTLWGLSRGMNRYNVTAVTGVNDGCRLAPGELLGMALPVTYDETTMIIGIGNPVGTPIMPVFGSGRVSANMAVLMRDNLSGGPSDSCTWHQRSQALLKLFGHDKFTLDVGWEMDMFSAGCTGADAPPAGGRCSSSWQLTLEKR